MESIAIGRLGGAPTGTHDEDVEEPFLEVAGVEGSTLRVTRIGLTVCPRRAMWSQAGARPRRWNYAQLVEVRLDAYGPVGIIRATIGATGSSLPLLLLEPDQIAAARRTLEIVWNIMGATDSRRHSA